MAGIVLGSDYKVVNKISMALAPTGLITNGEADNESKA